MSIIESLIKAVDPVQAKQREEERKAEREQPKHDRDADPPRFACRVCGYEDTEKGYCPQCLADTMAPVPRGSTRR
jgi:rubrerythrin